MRAWLVLSRLSNLPTVWSNVLAGFVLAGGAPDGNVPILVAAAVAVSLMYTGGMILNDVCDVEFDRAHRTGRPIPRGLVDRRLAALVATAQMAIGVVLLWWFAGGATVPWAIALVAAIAYYDIRHKRDPLAPLVMGICRGLVYAVAASMIGVALTWPLVIGAMVISAYVAGFTLAARHVPATRPWVSWYIAAISLVDAAALLVFGADTAAGVAALGLPLTLLFQRWIPGD